MSENIDQKQKDRAEIEDIISKFVEPNQKHQDNYFKGSYGDLFEEDQKHTDYQHEIFTKVIFQVLSINEKGQTVKVPRVVEKNYYIPLPLKEDFNKFIEIFDKHLQSSIQDAGKELLHKDKE